MIKRTVVTLLAAALLAAVPVPAFAWVAAYGGHRGGVAVGVHPGCCYGGATVAGAAVALAAYAPPAAVYVAPAPVYVAPVPVYAAPAPVAVLPVGTVVYSLPDGCAGDIQIGEVSYTLCGGDYYQPFYSGGALMYRVAVP